MTNVDHLDFWRFSNFILNKQLPYVVHQSQLSFFVNCQTDQSIVLSNFFDEFEKVKLDLQQDWKKLFTLFVWQGANAN